MRAARPLSLLTCLSSFLSRPFHPGASQHFQLLAGPVAFGGAHNGPGGRGREASSRRCGAGDGSAWSAPLPLGRSGHGVLVEERPPPRGHPIFHARLPTSGKLISMPVTAAPKEGGCARDFSAQLASKRREGGGPAALEVLSTPRQNDSSAVRGRLARSSACHLTSPLSHEQHSKWTGWRSPGRGGVRAGAVRGRDAPRSSSRAPPRFHFFSLSITHALSFANTPALLLLSNTNVQARPRLPGLSRGRVRGGPAGKREKREESRSHRVSVCCAVLEKARPPAARQRCLSSPSYLGSGCACATLADAPSRGSIEFS